MKQIRYWFSTIIATLLVFLLLFYSIDIPKEKEKIIKCQGANFQMDVIDVGQADCILISTGDKHMLVDAGNNEDGTKLVNYFKSIGIEEFEYIIATHAHEDHIGGMDNILRSFAWNHFYMPETVVFNKTYEDITNELQKQNRNIETPEIDSIFSLGDATVQVLSIKSNPENLNDDSIVLRIVYKNTSYLLMGDATINIETELLKKEIKSDVLKAGHHGSYDSNSQDFIEAVHPQIVVFTAEEGNEYGFPKEGVLKRYQNINASIFRTDIDGTIHIISDGYTIETKTEKTDTNQKE